MTVSRENLKPFKFSLKKLNKTALLMSHYSCKIQLTYGGAGDYGIGNGTLVPGFLKGTGTLDTLAALSKAVLWN
jgi:hypothetical protein